LEKANRKNDLRPYFDKIEKEHIDEIALPGVHMEGESKLVKAGFE